MKLKTRTLTDSEQFKQAVSAADALYNAAAEFYPNRPLFFFRIDELYLNLCTHSAGKSGSYFNKMMNEKLRRCFPKIIWTNILEDLADQYQRNCRKWVWLLFNGHTLNLPDHLDEMEAILKIHQLLLKGIRLSEIEYETNSHIQTELRCTYGLNDSVIPEFINQLKQSDFDNNLKALCGLNSKRCIEKPLQLAQDSLMWMGVVSLSPQNTERSLESIQELVKSLWSDVIDENQDHYDICFLAKQCVRRMSENRRFPYALMHYPYNQILDVSAKANAQLLFCIVYAIACTKEELLDSRTILNSTMELLHSLFTSTSQMQNIQAPVLQTIKGYCSLNRNGMIDIAVVKYFQNHYDFAEECFERLQKLYEDDLSRVESEISLKKTRAAEDIALMYQEREDEALGRLMETLANPIYGNVIGQLYRISEGWETNLTTDKICHLLNNLFLLMQQKMITPVADGDVLYPGWNIRGKTVVKPVEREGNE